MVDNKVIVSHNVVKCPSNCAGIIHHHVSSAYQVPEVVSTWFPYLPSNFVLLSSYAMIEQTGFRIIMFYGNQLYLIHTISLTSILNTYHIGATDKESRHTIQPHIWWIYSPLTEWGCSAG